MKILDTAKNGQPVNVIKTFDELTDEELAELRFPAGSTANDYANYGVQYNKKGELLRVSVHDFSQSQQETIGASQDKVNVLDVSAAMFGRGKVKQQALQKIAKRGVSESELKTALAPSEIGIVDEYLQANNTTRYQVAKATGFAASTLAKANRDAANATNISTKVIGAIAMTVGKTPGQVLNELIMADAKAGRA